LTNQKWETVEFEINNRPMKYLTG